MAETVWPIGSTDCHTRGTETDVNLRFDNLEGTVALALLIGRAMAITIHCDKLAEVEAIRDRLNDCIALAKGEPT